MQNPRSSALRALLLAPGGQGVAGSNPVIPTIIELLKPLDSLRPVEVEVREPSAEMREALLELNPVLWTRVVC